MLEALLGLAIVGQQVAIYLLLKEVRDARRQLLAKQLSEMESKPEPIITPQPPPNPEAYTVEQLEEMGEPSYMRNNGGLW